MALLLEFHSQSKVRWLASSHIGELWVRLRDPSMNKVEQLSVMSDMMSTYPHMHAETRLNTVHITRRFKGLVSYYQLPLVWSPAFSLHSCVFLVSEDLGVGK